MLLKSFESKILLPLSVLLVFFFVQNGYPEEIPGTYYVVKKGDTLWGISSSHYTDPFLWPRLWGKNPSIPHPDKIYPGEKIFLPAETYLKEISKNESLAPERETPEKEPEIVTSAEEEEMGPPETGYEEAEQGVSTAQPEPAVTSEVTKNPAWTINDLVTGGFISRESLQNERVGQIAASENEHTLLGEGDTVYVIPEKSQSFRIGDQYTIYQVIKPVRHPITRRLIGNLVRIKGYVEIVPNPMPGSGKETYTAKIIKSFDLVNLGDSLVSYHPVDPIDMVINQVPFPKDLKGVVVASRDIKFNNGQRDIVYLDKGSHDGVQPGHLLVVYKEGKKIPFYSPRGKEKLPHRIIAELEVISVQPETSTAIVSKSIEPIIIGDQISNPPLNP